MRIKIHILILSALTLLATGCGKDVTSHDLCAAVTCPVGAGCYEGNCVDSLIGNYHWVGSSSFWYVQHTQGYSIDDTSAIVRVNDSTLLCFGDQLIFYTGDFPAPIIATPDKYTFFASLSGPNSFADLKFNRPTDDSVYYDYYSAWAGGGTSTSLKGVKIK